MTASGFGSGSGCDDGSGSNSNSAPVPVSSSAPASTALTLEEELQEVYPQSAGERERVRVSDRIRLESQIHAAAPCPQLLPHRGIDDILEDQVEPGG